MGSIFTTNYKNLVLDYEKWSHLKVEDIPALRKGQGVEAPKLVDNNEESEESEKSEDVKQQKKIK